MSVRARVIGRKVTFNMGGDVILGVMNKSLNYTNEMAEVSDDTSNGVAEYVAEPLKKTMEFVVSGEVENFELEKAWNENASQVFEFVVTTEEGTVRTFDAALISGPNMSFDSNGVGTYECTFARSGTTNYVTA